MGYIGNIRKYKEETFIRSRITRKIEQRLWRSQGFFVWWELPIGVTRFEDSDASLVGCRLQLWLGMFSRSLSKCIVDPGIQYHSRKLDSMYWVANFNTSIQY